MTAFCFYIFGPTPLTEQKTWNHLLWGIDASIAVMRYYNPYCEKQGVMDFFFFFFTSHFFLLASQLNRAPLIRKWTGLFLQHISHSPSSFTDCATKWFRDFMRSEKQNDVSCHFVMPVKYFVPFQLLVTRLLTRQRMCLLVKHSANHSFTMESIMCFHNTFSVDYQMLTGYQMLYVKARLAEQFAVVSELYGWILSNTAHWTVRPWWFTNWKIRKNN